MVGCRQRLFSALLAERAGLHVRSIFLGAGVANASFGLPDLGITSLNDVCEDVRRITSATDVPLLVDADTGWGAAFNISRTISDLIKLGCGRAAISKTRCRPSAAVTGRARRSSRL